MYNKNNNWIEFNSDLDINEKLFQRVVVFVKPSSVQAVQNFAAGTSFTTGSRLFYLLNGKALSKPPNLHLKNASQIVFPLARLVKQTSSGKAASFNENLKKLTLMNEQYSG